MSAAVKYTLGRLGLFLLVLLALWPVPLNLLVKLMIAVLVSAVAAFFLLRSWRDQMAGELAGGAARRRAERERLRAALAGDDQAAGDGAGGARAAGAQTDPGAQAGSGAQAAAGFGDPGAAERGEPGAAGAVRDRPEPTS